MKKIIFIIIAIISVISLSSCGNTKSSKEEKLMQMIDSIENQIEWQTIERNKIFNRLDSLYENDIEMFIISSKYDLKLAENLQQRIEKEKDQIFQIQLQLNK